MANTLMSLMVKIGVDSSGFKNSIMGVEKSVDSLAVKMERLGAGMKRVGGIMTASLTLPALMVGKAAVEMSSSYEESLNKVNVVFEDSAKVIEDWSKTAAMSLGMSQQAALEAAGTYGNLFTAQGMTTKAAAEMSTSLVNLSADLASFNNASPEETLLAIRSGLSGEIEPLKKYGIALNEALMKQKAMQMGLGDNILALTEAQKIQVRYAIIMDQTAKAQGDFARTSAGMANQLRILKGEWGDTLKILGDQLRPVIQIVLAQLIKLLEWFNSAPPGVQKFVLAMLGLVVIAGPLLMVFGTLLPMMFKTATASINPFSGGILGLIAKLLKFISVAAIVVKVLGFLGVATGPLGAGILGLQAAIAGAGAGILTALLPVLTVLALIAAAVALVWLVWKNWDQLGTTISQLWFLIKMMLGEVMTTGKQLIFLIGLSLYNKIVAIGAVFLKIGNVIMSVFNAIGRAIDWVVAKVNGFAQKIASLSLPAWLKPGSPTPFEIGLLGIADAMGAVQRSTQAMFTKSSLPTMSPLSAAQPAMSGAASRSPAGNGGGTTIINITNPKKETAEESIKRTMKSLSYMGVIPA